MSRDRPIMDLDEPVNVEMEPEDALRVLLGEERREPAEDEPGDDSSEEITA